MLQQVFCNVLDMSIAAGYCAVFIMLFRIVLKRFPKSYSYVLWAIVFFRFLCPFVPESDWSLLPNGGISVFEKMLKTEDYDTSTILHGDSIVGSKDSMETVGEAGVENSGLSAVDIPREGLSGEENGIGIEGLSGEANSTGIEGLQGQESTSSEATSGQVSAAADSLAGAEYNRLPASEKESRRQVLKGLETVWLLGVFALLLHSMISNQRLKNSLKGAQQIAHGVYQLEGLQTAFVIGIVKSCIYLPANLEERDMRYVLAHEKVHMGRGDQLYKHIAYLAVCIHWFNPLAWLSFYFMCQDMEMSCDERVLGALGLTEKKAYSMALLSIASGKSLGFGMPIAFSENEARSRIKNVLHYRKPAIWLTVLAGVVIVILAAGLLCNPYISAAGQSEKIPDSAASAANTSVDTTAAAIESLAAKTEEELDTLINREAWVHLSDTEKLANAIDSGYMVPEKEEDKTVLTFGIPSRSVGEEANLYEVAELFNQQSREYRVEVIEYFEESEAYWENTDHILAAMLTGQCTDIIYTEFNKEALGLAGILVDLKEFIAEEEWDTVYVGNILEAGSTGDKLYGIGPAFNIYTLAANADAAGSGVGWTADELWECLEESKRGIHGMVTAADESLISVMGRSFLDDFVDWEEGTCHFEQDDFYQILAFTKEKATTPSEKDMPTLKEGFIGGEYVVSFETMSGVSSYQLLEEIYGGKLQIKGTPTAYGTGVTAQIFNQVGMCSFSNHKEGAWEFIKFYLNAPVTNLRAFPTVRARLEEYLQEATETEYYVDEKTKEPIQEMQKGMWGDIRVYAADPQEVQAVRDIIALVDRESRTFDYYRYALEEEAEAYYRGEVSAEEAAAGIQSRMSLYLQELRE